MKRTWLLLLMSGCTALHSGGAGEGLPRSEAVGCPYDASRWPRAPATLPEFIPLGFSEDGWLAWIDRPGGSVLEFESRYCATPPCVGVTLNNVLCEPGCTRDSPGDENDVCYCPMGTTPKELKTFRIQPLDKRYASGCFPLEREGDELNIEFTYKARLVRSIVASDPETHPGTEVVLVSRKRGRKLLHVIDHDHAGFSPHTAQALGWLQTPFPSRIVVVIAGGTGWDSEGHPTQVSNLVIGVDLSEG